MTTLEISLVVLYLRGFSTYLPDFLSGFHQLERLLTVPP